MQSVIVQNFCINANSWKVIINAIWMPFCTNLNCLHAQTCLRRAAVVAAASAAASLCVREWASEQVNARASLGAPSRLHWPVCCCRCCLLPAFWTLFESQRVWERAREKMHLRKKLVLQVIIFTITAYCACVCLFRLCFWFFFFIFFCLALYLFYLCVTIMIIKTAAVH